MEKKLAVLLFCIFVVNFTILQIVAFDYSILTSLFYILSWISFIVFIVVFYFVFTD